MWTVDDALRITARFADWLDTRDALRLSEWQVWRVVGKLLDPGGDDDLAELARAGNRRLAQGVRQQDPIWCDPHMVDLLAVAAAELPTDKAGVQPWQLPYPDYGVVLFARPLPTDWQEVDNGEGTRRERHDEISAITWERVDSNCWVVRSWARGNTSGVYTIVGAGTMRCPDLRPAPVVEALGYGSWVTPVGRILMALTGLTRTAGTVGESREHASKAAHARAIRANMHDPSVRRLYLIRPESGAAELDALREHRSGTPRGHWVRGHWKRQWYASVEEHRWQWIDGFPRGDFTKGRVSGDRIQIARAGATSQP